MALNDRDQLLAVAGALTRGPPQGLMEMLKRQGEAEMIRDLLDRGLLERDGDFLRPTQVGWTILALPARGGKADRERKTRGLLAWRGLILRPFGPQREKLCVVLHRDRRRPDPVLMDATFEQVEAMAVWLEAINAHVSHREYVREIASTA